MINVKFLVLFFVQKFLSYKVKTKKGVKHYRGFRIVRSIKSAENSGSSL